MEISVIELPPQSASNEIEMRTISPQKFSESSSEFLEEAAKKLTEYTIREKLSLLIPIISILVTVAATVLMIVLDGKSGLLVCRIFALYSIVFLIVTFGRMLWNVIKIQRSGHYRLAGASHVSRTIKLFIYFMTLATVVGYYNRFSYMRIFWNFDFVLNYSIRDVELPIDVFCVTVLILYLLFQAYYVIIVAPRIGVTIVEKSLFGTTLFLNAFQKWLLETMLVQSEICKTFNTQCISYIQYESNRTNLTEHQQDMYVEVEGGASFTYTCNLELFIGILALLLYLPAPIHRSALQMMLASGAALISVNPGSSPLKQHFPKWITGVLWGEKRHEERHNKIADPPLAIIKPHWSIRTAFYLYCFILGFLPLYIIYVIPIIKVNVDDQNEIFNLLLALLLFQIGLFAFLAFFDFYVFRNCKLQPILEEPDLIILVIASCIIALKYLGLIVFETAVDIFTARKIEPVSSIVIDSISIFFEIPTFFILVHFTQKFFHLGHKSNPAKEKQWLHMFPTSFLALYFLYHGIIGFAMYYLLNRLRIPFPSTESKDLDNALSIVHSLYPTTTLFSMTMTLCFGHIVEKFHDARLYDFKKQRKDLKGTAEEIRNKLGQY